MLAIPGDARELAAERQELVRAHFADVDFVPGFSELFPALDGRFKTCLATAMDPELFRLVDTRLADLVVDSFPEIEAALAKLGA